MEIQTNTQPHNLSRKYSMSFQIMLLQQILYLYKDDCRKTGVNVIDVALRFYEGPSKEKRRSPRVKQSSSQTCETGAGRGNNTSPSPSVCFSASSLLLLFSLHKPAAPLLFLSVLLSPITNRPQNPHPEEESRGLIPDVESQPSMTSPELTCSRMTAC